LGRDIRAIELLFSITLFVVFGVAFVFVNLLVGALARPKNPSAEKQSVYECGEPAVGPGWVQFDLRFYVVALVFLIFDVEVALFYPWAVTYGNAANLPTPQDTFALRSAALVDMLVFFGILLVGFAYLWRFGYLDWVRAVTHRDAENKTRTSEETMPG
jgi:NADH-quinone oxidoreductase subunit A